MKTKGETQEFLSGARRSSQEGKARLDLIDPAFELAVARVMAEGAKPPPEGYGEGNWEKGMPYSRLYASMRRHLLAWWVNMNDEDHLAHLACNIMFAIRYRDLIYKKKLPKNLDDRRDEEFLASDLASPEKNVEAFLTSAKKPPTIGRDWKVKKTFTTEINAFPFCTECGYRLKLCEEIDYGVGNLNRCPKCGAKL